MDFSYEDIKSAAISGSIEINGRAVLRIFFLIDVYFCITPLKKQLFLGRFVYHTWAFTPNAKIIIILNFLAKERMAELDHPHDSPDLELLTFSKNGSWNKVNPIFWCFWCSKASGQEYWRALWKANSRKVLNSGICWDALQPKGTKKNFIVIPFVCSEYFTCMCCIQLWVLLTKIWISISKKTLLIIDDLPLFRLNGLLCVWHKGWLFVTFNWNIKCHTSLTMLLVHHPSHGFRSIIAWNESCTSS